MTFFKYVKDHRGQIVLSLLLVASTLLFIQIYPQMKLTQDFIWSLFLLLFALQSLFLVIGYLRKRDYYKKLAQMAQQLEEEQGDDFPQNEEKYVLEILTQLKQKQKETLQQYILKQQEQEEFLNRWVHEIKIPIEALSLIKENIAEDIPELRVYQMEMELDKIEKDVQQVLYFTRLDAFSKDYLIQELDLKQVVETSLKTFANYFILKHLTLTFEGESFLVLSDEKWLSYIIQQVLSNAVKYTAEGGEITIAFRKENHLKILEIKDNGQGIPKEDLPRIFEKGFTGAMGRKEQQSTGLGLYLSYNLMRKLGHQLKVTSKLGEGTTVAFIFGDESNFLF